VHGTFRQQKKKKFNDLDDFSVFTCICCVGQTMSFLFNFEHS